MNLHEKILSIAGKVEAVRKTGYNQHHKYKFHSHNAVTAAVRDLLLEHKLVTEVTMRDGACVVTLVDVEGDGRLEGAFDIPRPNDQPQSTGAIVSYAIKLMYMKTFMMEDESPDAENIKPKVTTDQGTFDRKLTELATTKTKDALDTFARGLDQSDYSKDQWKQLSDMYKERLNAIANSDG